MEWLALLLEVDLIVLILMCFLWYSFNKRITLTEHKLDKDYIKFESQDKLFIDIRNCIDDIKTQEKETQNKLNEILVKIEQIKKD